MRVESTSFVEARGQEHRNHPEPETKVFIKVMSTTAFAMSAGADWASFRHSPVVW
jgi:hypothetical protein